MFNPLRLSTAGIRPYFESHFSNTNMGHLGERSAHPVCPCYHIYCTLRPAVSSLCTDYSSAGLFGPRSCSSRKGYRDDHLCVFWTHYIPLHAYSFPIASVTVIGGPPVDPGLLKVSQQCQILISTVRGVWIVPYLATILHEIGESKSRICKCVRVNRLVTVTLSLTLYKFMQYYREIPRGSGRH
jgi:hypothetical protein